MSSPLVSVIVPVYNTAEYVEECILSILSQSFRDLELILIDDGSSDSSVSICERFASYPNVFFIKQENAGKVAARRRGLESARGTWIVFVDSDDFLLPDGVQQLMHLALNTDIVIGGHIGSSFLESAPSCYRWDEYLSGLYDTSIQGAPWAKIYKKDLIYKCPHAFDYNLIRAGDVIMNLAIARINRKDVPVCSEPVYYYRKRLTSVSYTNAFSFDDCNYLSGLAESLVDGVLPIESIESGGLKRRLYFFYKVLEENDFHSNKNHPFVRGIVQRMNEAKILRLSDRLVLSVSSKPAVKMCLFFAKFLRRIEQPSMIRKDIQRLFKR